LFYAGTWPSQYLAGTWPSQYLAGTWPSQYLADFITSGVLWSRRRQELYEELAVIYSMKPGSLYLKPNTLAAELFHYYITLVHHIYAEKTVFTEN